ncbi:HAMP domain-containing methyl-accepting chemotaxis protein [Crenobacter sp. SG2303]|uniref:HAMP domain-containing methyl-accepting chemotaxis protein n=1 Tax=Crenobacter oryzisoli TaxID=3056844 RepID=A0ABT7XNC4_9NEIS|nr:HAMP domain-containing methyl-accepting chemotaxis protein [Crenobacter sp. SG2303]MDN0075297.1 HAMP domain-containing methyl-accepting chemotaxis protein [Crenobacter sp. SG2303]
MQWFSALRISVRLTIGFGIMLSLMVLLGFGSLRAIGALSDVSLDVVDNTMPSALRIQRIRANIFEVQQHTLHATIANDAQSREHALALRNDALKRLKNNIAEYAQYVDTPLENRDYPVLKQNIDLWLGTSAQAISLLKESNVAAAQALLLGKGEEAASKVGTTLDELVAFNKDQAHKSRDTVTARGARARVGVMVGVGVSLLLAVVLAIMLVRSILAPINQAVAVADRIADRDLTQDIDGANDHNETGQMLSALKRMQDALRHTLFSMQGDAGKLADAAGALAAASDQVANSSGLQSEATASVAAAIEELSASISISKDAAGDSAVSAKKSAQLSKEGGEVIRATVSEMQTIAETVKGTETAISELNGHANAISTVVDVIRDVADQTNLLALNAAIEAARAGETGRGFAVVADEVRKLADRTTTATKEIAGMIEQIQHGANVSVESMQAAVNRVMRGYELAEQAGSAIEGILQGANVVHESVASISTAVIEQNTTSLQIAANIEQVAQMIDENSAAAISTASSATRLNEVAKDISCIVSQFRLPSRLRG